MTSRISELATEKAQERFEGIGSSSVLLALTLDDEAGGIAVTRDAFDSEMLHVEIARVLAVRASSTESFVCLYQAAARRLRALGITHLLRRVDARDFAEIWALESSGFRLMDIGITMGRRLDDPLAAPAYTDLAVGASTDDVMRTLVDVMVSRPWWSRYEADPDYKTEDVRELRRQWLWNCHRGRADIVLVGMVAGEPTGYVTCRTDPVTGHGQIELVGTLPAFRGRDIASRILEHALAWFSSRTDFVTTRTQATNYAAAGLYTKSGFVLHRSDLTFRLSLRAEEEGHP